MLITFSCLNNIKYVEHVLSNIPCSEKYTKDPMMWRVDMRHITSFSLFVPQRSNSQSIVVLNESHLSGFLRAQYLEPEPIELLFKRFEKERPIKFHKTNRLFLPFLFRLCRNKIFVSSKHVLWKALYYYYWSMVLNRYLRSNILLLR